MNPLDKKTLIGIAVISTAAYLFLKAKQANNKPIKLLGLDASNSIKFVGAVAILSVAVITLPLAKQIVVKS